MWGELPYELGIFFWGGGWVKLGMNSTHFKDSLSRFCGRYENLVCSVWKLGWFVVINVNNFVWIVFGNCSRCGLLS